MGMNRIKVLRNEAGLSLRELGKKVEITFSTLGLLETEKQPLRQHHIERLSSFFNCSADYSSHCFRHTRASELGSKCENIGDVIFCAKWLGHSPSMFLNTYCHNISNKIDNKFLV
jgi:transcriptional regulator with XRE-family HTH domain